MNSKITSLSYMKLFRYIFRLALDLEERCLLPKAPKSNTSPNVIHCELKQNQKPPTWRPILSTEILCHPQSFRSR